MFCLCSLCAHSSARACRCRVAARPRATAPTADPGAMIDVATRQMVVSYSIGKEDIALTRFGLSEIMG